MLSVPQTTGLPSLDPRYIYVCVWHVSCDMTRLCDMTRVERTSDYMTSLAWPEAMGAVTDSDVTCLICHK